MKKLSKPTEKDVELTSSRDILENLWDQQFSTTYELKKLSDTTVKYLQGIVGKKKRGILLDCGCGTGRIKKFFEDNRWVCFGSDISKEGLKIASKITPINLINSPAHDLPFKDNFFDLVIFWRVLHNITPKSRKKSIKEIERILKKGGLLVCCVQSKEDIDTLSKYKNNGIEVKDDPNTFVVNQRVGDKIMPYIKHFYSKEDIKNEIEKDTKLKTQKITLIKEKSGLEAVDRKVQMYWIVEAQKDGN